MRVKQAALVVTFATTTDAMEMERFCQERELPGRLIPLPREISAGCGLAWKSPPEAKDRILAALTASGRRWDTMRVIEI